MIIETVQRLFGAQFINCRYSMGKKAAWSRKWDLRTVDGCTNALNVYSHWKEAEREGREGAYFRIVCHMDFDGKKVIGDPRNK
tara:strand:- start:1398 stop:1646 length:249 start_codon:yes stop_codon:yes gene_type:complete